MRAISAEFGLNVMFRYLEGRAYGGPLLARSTLLGVVLYGLTTIVGFGSLLIAAHRGIFSLGLLLTIGCACGSGRLADRAAATLSLARVARLFATRDRAGYLGAFSSFIGSVNTITGPDILGAE